MSNVIGNMVKAVTLLVGLPAVALLVYDTVAIRPHLAEIEGLLANADVQDATPPSIVRDLIDANPGSPRAHATRLVTSRMYSNLGQGQQHIRNALWRILLPLHFDKTQMYGLYATLAYNGTDYGLSNFSRREYSKALDRLSPMQAATTVAITHAPMAYLKDRDRLNKRAIVLLTKSGHAP